MIQPQALKKAARKSKKSWELTTPFRSKSAAADQKKAVRAEEARVDDAVSVEVGLAEPEHLDAACSIDAQPAGRLTELKLPETPA